MAHAAWETASDKSNWWASGCGFVFRADAANEAHYMVYLALDGNARLAINLKGKWKLLGTSFYGSVGIPSGEADIALAAVGPMVTFLVNGRAVHTWRTAALADGNLAYTLVSGTNKDYGFHCKLTDVRLWVPE